jgi:hypothetical protein
MQLAAGGDDVAVTLLAADVQTIVLGVALGIDNARHFTRGIESVAGGVARTGFKQRIARFGRSRPVGLGIDVQEPARAARHSTGNRTGIQKQATGIVILATKLGTAIERSLRDVHRAVSQALGNPRTAFGCLRDGHQASNAVIGK